MNLIKLFLFTTCTFFFVLTSINGQSTQATKKKDPEQAYQKRIKQEYLFGVYIPKDLSEAFLQFNKLIEKETQAKFKNVPEEEADRRLHFGFGKWISHNYAFFEGSRFSHYLNSLGLHDPDDMITFVITTYHRNLNQRTLDVKDLLDTIITRREKIIQDRKLKGELISSEKRKVEVHPDSLKQN